MIPKIIHYCWLGKGEKSELINKCIASWKKYYSDYTFIEWNESNFDIQENQYARESYNERKYAFVSDYIRLKVLYEYGGIYLDTDVEILKKNTGLEQYDFIVGFEAANRIGSAVIMSEKQNILIKSWLDSYNNRHFIDLKGKSDFTPNVKKLTEILAEYGFSIDGKRQIKDNYVIFEKNIFYPYAIGDSEINIDDSLMVHWCDGSWVSGRTKVRHQLVVFIKRIIGSNNYDRLKLLKDKKRK